jgi:hypothetical protein
MQRVRRPLPVAGLVAAVALVAVLLLSASGGGASWAVPSARQVASSAHGAVPAAAPIPRGINAAYALRWIAQATPVLSVNGGIWDNMGQLLTVGTHAYTCYANTSDLAGGSLYLVTNQSGTWQSDLISPSIWTGNADVCSIATGEWNGKTVEFIAFESAQLGPLGITQSIQLAYNPSGAATGPWVNVSVVPPGGSMDVPDAPSVAIFDNTTVAVAFENSRPIYSPGPTPASFVWSMLLSGLPTTAGGQPTTPWLQNVPSYNDPNSNWDPTISANAQGLTMVYQDEGPFGAGGGQGFESATMYGTVMANGNTSWTSNGGLPWSIATTTGSTGYGDGVGLQDGHGSTDLVAWANASSSWGELDLQAALGSGSTWSAPVDLGSVTDGANGDIPGVAQDACGFSLGYARATAVGDGVGGTPSVWTENGSGWSAQAIGAANASNEVPNFVDVAAQGQYVDALYVNQPDGGNAASGNVVFYAAQAICTNSTLNGVSASPSPVSVTFQNSSLVLASATSLSGSALYPGDGVHYSWVLKPSSVGTLNASSGPLVNFTGADAWGNATLFVNASQYGWIDHTIVLVQVAHPAVQSSPVTPSSSPSSPDLWYAIAAAIVAVGAVGGYLSFRHFSRARPRAPSAATAPPPAPAPPPPPPPPAPPPPA